MDKNTSWRIFYNPVGQNEKLSLAKPLVNTDHEWWDIMNSNVVIWDKNKEEPFLEQRTWLVSIGQENLTA